MVVHFYHVRHDWGQQLWHKNTFYYKSFCTYYHHYCVASYLLLYCKLKKSNELKKLKKKTTKQNKEQKNSQTFQ